jgi:hypothetical protein
MRQTTHTTQVFTPFGGYIPEQRADGATSNLAPADVGHVVNALTVSMFDEVMKSLRSALSLN